MEGILWIRGRVFKWPDPRIWRLGHPLGGDCFLMAFPLTLAADIEIFPCAAMPTPPANNMIRSCNLVHEGTSNPSVMTGL
jgi:hypothetical protein